MAGKTAAAAATKVELTVYVSDDIRRKIRVAVAQSQSWPRETMSSFVEQAIRQRLAERESNHNGRAKRLNPDDG